MIHIKLGKFNREALMLVTPITVFTFVALIVFLVMYFIISTPSPSKTQTMTDPPKLEEQATLPFCKIDQDYYGLHQSLRHELWIYDQSACEEIDRGKRVADIWNKKPSRFIKCDVNDEDADGNPSNMQRITVTHVDWQLVTWQYDHFYRATDRIHPTRMHEKAEIGFCGKVWKIGEHEDKYAVLLGHLMINKQDDPTTPAGKRIGSYLNMVWMDKADYNNAFGL